MREDKMVLAAFSAASVEQTRIGAWMHPGSDPYVTEPEHYVNLARGLERDGFDFIFFDDRLAMPATYGSSHHAAAGKGVRAIKLDLLTLLGLISAHTSRIGLGGTYSTTYYNPYHVARAFATLDHLSKGRAIWNIVTSLNVDEAKNFGVEEHLSHDLRYDRADEFLEIATGLWESWEPDAIELNVQTGRYADPEKVHALNYSGKYLSSQGPLTVPRSPQGWPVLLQAGSSGRGREFAARWADLIFMVAHDVESGKRNYAAQHEAFATVGRTAPPARLLPTVRVVVGPTEAAAREKLDFLEQLRDGEESLIVLSELSGIDLAVFPFDEPLPDDFLERVGGSQGIMGNALESVRKRVGRQPTPRDLGNRPGVHEFVGDPSQVADQMAEWFEAYACDGFAIMQNDSPGSFEEFGRYVVPELRRRSLVGPRTDAPQTVRERLELGDRARTAPRV